MSHSGSLGDVVQLDKARPGPFPERFLQTRLKLHQLTFLVAIEEERSIARAAARLNISQPAATKNLKEIEVHLGLPLFERSRRGAVPTAYGELVVRSARVILAELRQLGEELSALRTGAAGRVVVGTLLAASATLLPGALARLRRGHPDITVRIVEGTWDLLIPMLRTGDIDLVLGRLPSSANPDGVALEDLYREKTCIVARPGHPLLRSGLAPPTPAELAAADWILPSHQTMLRRDIDDAFRALGLAPPRPAVESVTALANQGLIAQTDLLAFLPWGAARPGLATGTLAILPAELGLRPARTGMMTRSTRPLTPAAQRLAESVRAEAERLGDIQESASIAAKPA
jgi:DNA-binding transcriptional LysR family regulator